MFKPLSIYLGCDPAGLKLKAFLKEYFDKYDINYTDLGIFGDKDEKNYVEITREVCEKVFEKKAIGILISDTGIGMSIEANRRKGIRAALCFNEVMAELARRNDSANVLCLAADFLEMEEAKKILKVFTSTPFADKK